MKINIRNDNAVTKKEEIIGYLEEIGIKRDKIIFSDCFFNNVILKKDKCDCQMWDEKVGDIFIYFGSSSWFDHYKPAIINLFLKKRIKKLKSQLFSFGTYQYLDNKYHDIGINVGNCLERGINIKNVLYHEMLHIKENPTTHCLNNGCFFSEDKNTEKIFFCKNCENNLKHIVKKINLEENNSS